MSWQPIETAPKDGTVVIGYDPSGAYATRSGFEFMRWLDGQWCDPETHRMYPTHWMPLPDPPEQQP